jgi:HTH-type transcriptional repressor of NAD biosynthesis genes
MKTIGQFGGKFLPFHNGHLFAILKAAELVDELYVVLCYNRELDRRICQQDACKDMPPELRLAWIAHTLKKYNYANIKIIAVEYFEDNYDWKKGSDEIKRQIDGELTHVFSSEPANDVHFSNNYPNAKHVILDQHRSFLHISGTQVRRGKFYEDVPPIVKAHFIKKILITGIESVGKSTFVQKLAHYFNSIGIQEIGRQYCEDYQNFLTPDMFPDIAMKHWIAQQDSLINCNEFLFVDSDAVVTEYYLYKYHNIHVNNLIKEIILKQDYDYIFYLNSDVPWVADGYRFLEDTREGDDEHLKSMYKKYGIDFIEISGLDYEQKLKDIIRILYD